jgi:hypothetical protein
LSLVPSRAREHRPLRGGSAEKRYFVVCTLRCRVPCGARRLPALHCGVFHLGTVLPGPDTGAEPRADPGRLSPALHPDRVQPLKAALRFKGGREPKATRTSCVRAQGRGRHTCSANQTPPEGALN